MLRVTLAVAVLPALSRAVPEITCWAPSVETTTAAGQNASFVSSAHVKRTVTFVRFQPLAFAAGVAVAVMVGGVVSAARAVPVPDRTPATDIANSRYWRSRNTELWPCMNPPERGSEFAPC
jgi:hypothetical protein